MFHKYTEATLRDMQEEARDDPMLQGVDWAKVERITDFRQELDKQLPGKVVVLCCDLLAPRSLPLSCHDW